MALTDAVAERGAARRPVVEAAASQSRLVPRVGWLAAAAAAFVLVVLTQVAGRGTLVWDEAARVGAGEHLSLALRAHDPGQVWDWFNAQTFYPFLEPALHGLALFLGASPVAAGWLPSTVAFVVAGLLAA
ncbi:MAG: hypothetical protein QOJ09_430, partial [Actinomycetota bacterium]|nr:hypothetical protein [Actinomycetota bacterium]